MIETTGKYGKPCLSVMRGDVPLPLPQICYPENQHKYPTTIEQHEAKDRNLTICSFFTIMTQCS